MLGKLFLIFTLVTLIELGLLIQLGRWMGLWGTLALIFGTGFLGAWLARKEGLRVVTRMRAEVERRQVPADSALDGVLVLLAGAFLITPGALTDLVGLALLIPVARAPVKRWLRARLSRWIAQGEVRFVVSSDRWGPGPPRGTRRAEVVDVRTEPPTDPEEDP